MRLILLLLLVLPGMAMSKLDVIDSIASAIRSGNAKEISRYFDSNVEITILDRESTYSRIQGEMVLKDFFAKNAVQSFELIHRGNSDDGSTYGIGKLKTSSQMYRVAYFAKQKGGQAVIQEMRFEKQK